MLPGEQQVSPKGISFPLTYHKFEMIVLFWTTASSSVTWWKCSPRLLSRSLLFIFLFLLFSRLGVAHFVPGSIRRVYFGCNRWPWHQIRLSAPIKKNLLASRWQSQPGSSRGCRKRGPIFSSVAGGAIFRSYTESKRKVHDRFIWKKEQPGIF